MFQIELEQNLMSSSVFTSVVLKIDQLVWDANLVKAKGLFGNAVDCSQMV